MPRKPVCGAHQQPAALALLGQFIGRVDAAAGKSLCRIHHLHVEQARPVAADRRCIGRLPRIAAIEAAINMNHTVGGVCLAAPDQPAGVVVGAPDAVEPCGRRGFACPGVAVVGGVEGCGLGRRVADARRRAREIVDFDLQRIVGDLRCEGDAVAAAQEIGAAAGLVRIAAGAGQCCLADAGPARRPEPAGPVGVDHARCPCGAAVGSANDARRAGAGDPARSGVAACKTAGKAVGAGQLCDRPGLAAVGGLPKVAWSFAVIDVPVWPAQRIADVRRWKVECVPEDIGTVLHQLPVQHVDFAARREHVRSREIGGKQRRAGRRCQRKHQHDRGQPQSTFLFLAHSLLRDASGHFSEPDRQAIQSDYGSRRFWPSTSVVHPGLFWSVS